jgi:hypothetical protein
MGESKNPNWNKVNTPFRPGDNPDRFRSLAAPSKRIRKLRDDFGSYLDGADIDLPDSTWGRGNTRSRFQRCLEWLYKIAANGDRNADRINAIKVLFDYSGIRPPEPVDPQALPTLVPEQEFNRIMQEAGWIKVQPSPEDKQITDGSVIDAEIVDDNEDEDDKE